MIVLDSSAAVEMVRNSIDGIALRCLARRNEKILSCELFRAEVASVFRKLSRTEKLPASMVKSYFEEALCLVDEFIPIDSLQTEALCESIRLDHSTYDMFYFVLARRTGATLFTLDRKLMRLCEENGVRCISEVLLEEPPTSD